MKKFIRKIIVYSFLLFIFLNGVSYLILKKLSSSEFYKPQFVKNANLENKFDYVICGHIHEPKIETIKNEKGETLYLNSGDWIENLTSLEYQNNEWTIYQYDEKQFADTVAPVVTMEKKLPQLNVVTDEIALFIHSLAIQP